MSCRGRITYRRRSAPCLLWREEGDDVYIVERCGDIEPTEEKRPKTERKTFPKLFKSERGWTDGRSKTKKYPRTPHPTPYKHTRTVPASPSPSPNCINASISYVPPTSPFLSSLTGPARSIFIPRRSNGLLVFSRARSPSKHFPRVFYKTLVIKVSYVKNQKIEIHPRRSIGEIGAFRLAPLYLVFMAFLALYKNTMVLIEKDEEREKGGRRGKE